MALVGEGFFYALTGIQISLVMLAAPAATAGAINMDQARGTLLHMLVTDLSDAEIVLDKLAARLVPVCGLIACAVPVTALAALLGGIDFGALMGSFVVSLALAVLGCSLALTLSVWVPKMHEVLMAVYAAIGIWLLALPYWRIITSLNTAIMRPPDWFEKTNPYVLVFAPYTQPGFASAVDYAVFAGVVLAFSAALLGLSIARLRPVVIGRAGRPEEARREQPIERVRQRVFPSWFAPTLDGNPVLWREWHRNRPSKLARRVCAGLLIITWALAAWGAYDIITEGVVLRGPSALDLGLVLQLLLGMLLLSASAPTALAEERVRGSLDLLLATPLTTGSILAAKWWGMYRRVFVLALLPLFAGVLLAAASPDVPIYPAALRWAGPPVRLTAWDRILAALFCVADFLASGAIFVSLGLALATWVRRLGRAVALSVSFYVAAIVWLFPCLMLLDWIHRWILAHLRSMRPSRQFSLLNQTEFTALLNQIEFTVRHLLQSLSPIFGPIVSIEMLRISFVPRTITWFGLGIVIMLKAACAGGLFAFTVRTFDRCLGRMPESGNPRSARRPAEREQRRPVGDWDLTS
jgi:hypothetical protein